MLYEKEGLEVMYKALSEYNATTRHEAFITEKLKAHIYSLLDHIDHPKVDHEDIETIIMAIEDLPTKYEDIDWGVASLLVDKFNQIVYESGLR